LTLQEKSKKRARGWRKRSKDINFVKKEKLKERKKKKKSKSMGGIGNQTTKKRRKREEIKANYRFTGIKRN